MVEYKLSGKKGARKIIKTISISEGTYQVFHAVENGRASFENEKAPSIKEVYSVFGGNCFGPVVSMSLLNTIGDFTHRLEEKGELVKDGQEVFDLFCDVFLPVMVMVKGKEGSDELRFFNTDIDEVLNTVSECLSDDLAAYVVHVASDCVHEVGVTVSEAVILTLVYYTHKNESDKENENVN